MRITGSMPVRLEIAALVATLAGMFVQIAFGVHYGTVPPGIVIIIVLGLLLALVPSLPVRLVGLAVTAFIMLGAFVSENGRANISHPGHTGAFTGTIIQLFGLAVAIVAAVASLAEWVVGRRADNASA